MSSVRIKWALLGGGPNSLIGIVHRIAAGMGEDYELVGGIFSADRDTGLEFAANLGLDPRRVYAGIDELISLENALPIAERVRVVSVATPNHLHYETAARLLGAGFHVICEKPVTTTSAEALELAALAKSQQRVLAVAHVYTGYPMVRQMRSMIAAGAIGAVHEVDAQYYQGWINTIIREPERWATVWRLDPARGGQSCCMGDIGVHAFNLIEYTSGLRIEQVLADLETIHPHNALDVDGSVLLRLSGGAKGILCASQVATAEENNLRIAAYGRTGALKWSQESPNELEFPREGAPMSVIRTGHALNEPAARAATKLPPGHPEGFFDAMGNLYRGVARAVNGAPVDEGAFPDSEAGVRGMRFVEAVLASARAANAWIGI